jgi:hypothetical protein
MQGRYDGSWLDSLPLRQAKWLTKEAKSAGIDISGKYYMSGLADKRGHMDPEAWVSGVDDIKRVAVKRNLNVEGIVTVKGHEVEKQSVGLNPKIVNRLAKAAMEKDPKLSKREAVAMVKDRHTPKWKKKRK